MAGGGAYYIVSRSFGESIGGTIGIALYISQAISVAFYIVAFAEAFQPVYELVEATRGVQLDPRWVSLPCTIVIITLMLTKGADLGVQVLWVVSIVLTASIAAFLLGKGPAEMDLRPEGLNLTATIPAPDSFGTVFRNLLSRFHGYDCRFRIIGGTSKTLKEVYPSVRSERHSLGC